MTMFSCFIGIDYSGAETPDASLRGLQIARVEHDQYVRLVPPPQGSKKYWTREGIAHWLVDALSDGPATIVGIDHGFSFPLAYFKKHKIARSWPAFLDDFCAAWPTDRPHTYVDFVRDDQRRGLLPARTGFRRWRRLTEICAGPAKSVFHFDVQGSVAKSTHAGLPWLRYVRQQVRRPIHFWPFDGWVVPSGQSAIVEVYPRLWRLPVPTPYGMTEHELDAHIIARTLCDADVDGRLERWLTPGMSAKARAVADIEGWILGVDTTLADSAMSAAPRRRRRGAPSGMTVAEQRGMPQISRFFGITISMFYSEHGVPHFHADYAGQQASVEIETGLVRGTLGPTAERLVLEWLALHRAELLENWQRARAQEPLNKIAPLD